MPVKRHNDTVQRGRAVDQPFLNRRLAASVEADGSSNCLWPAVKNTFRVARDHRFLTRHRHSRHWNKGLLLDPSIVRDESGNEPKEPGDTNNDSPKPNNTQQLMCACSANQTNEKKRSTLPHLCGCAVFR